MLQVMIDTSIYRADAKRQKSAFRALTRLLRGKKAQLHLPHYVKREFLSQQMAGIADAIAAVEKAASDILRKTSHKKFKAYAKTLSDDAAIHSKQSADWLKAEFDQWVSDCQVIEHLIHIEHGRRVTDDYFSGAPPFTSPKNRLDIPDSFIWQTAVDIAQKHELLHVVANDTAIFEAASNNNRMQAYKTLEIFIQTSACQAALRELDQDQIVESVERAKDHMQRQLAPKLCTQFDFWWLRVSFLSRRFCLSSRLVIPV
jgi:hypothetical protein